MSVADNAIHVGVESTFNTAVATTRSYDATSDEANYEIKEIKRPVMRKGQVAGPASMVKWYPRGTGLKLNKAVSTSGDGILFDSIFSNSSIVTTVQTHESGGSASPTSLTWQVARSGTDNVVVNTHAGSVATNFELTHSPSDELLLSVDYYSAGAIDRVTAEGTPAYVDASTFVWTDMTVFTIDGLTFCPMDFKFNADLGLNWEDVFLCTTANQPRPVKTGMLEGGYTIKVPVDSNTETLLDSALADDEMEVVTTWDKGGGGATLTLTSQVKLMPVAGKANIDTLSEVELQLVLVDDPTATKEAVSLVYDTKVDTSF